VALAPADFYAYSRATGQPYPESPEERAQQAPEVLEFRRNQLKSQESSNSNPIALGLGIGLGLAGLGGASLAARRMLQSGKAKGQSGSYQADLSNYDAAQIREVGRYKPASVAPSKVAMDASVAPVQRTVGIQTAVDDEVTRLLNDPGLLKLVEAEEADIINRLPEMRAEQSRQQGQVRRALSATADDILLGIRSEPTNTLVTQQQATGGFNVRQAMAALESGEDQQTGRMKNQLQRNEDLDLGQVEILEDIASQQRNWMMEQDEPISRVASQLPDGVPVKQTETLPANGPTFVQQFLQRERDEIASQMGEQGLTSPSLAEKELARRIGPESYQYGPEYTKIKQQIELGLQDPSILQVNETPKTFNIGGGEFPINVKNVMVDDPEMAFRKPYISSDTAISSEQSFVDEQNAIKNWLGDIRVEVAPQLNKLKQEEGLLAEQHNMLMYALNKKPDRELGEQFKVIGNQLKQNRSQQDFLNRRLSGATFSAQEQLSELSKWTPSTLTDWSGEGAVVRPKLTAPDTMSFEAEGGELSNIERGSRMAQPGPEDLEIVPGGLLSGGRAKVVSNIGQDVGFDPTTGERVVVPLVDETGERIVQKLAGKRMGEDVGVRGRGGVAGLDTKASIGIYGPELSEYGTAAQTKTGQYTQEASQVPSLVNSVPVQKTTGGYFKYPQQREADPAKYTQEATPERIASVLISEQVRKGQLSLPKQDINSYPSSILARPVRINSPEEMIKPSPTQLSFPSDVVPATAAAARVRVTPADQAAQQLEAYMGRLQRGRTSPLTSQVRIQPSLF
jgi:hypothetical protein